jgi:hypothetical protein
VALLLVGVATGCGLQTEQANQALARASKHQQDAEVILARIKGFPAEWQAVFAAPRSPDQVAKGRQLLQARDADLIALAGALRSWKLDLQPIDKMNVDDKIKEYVRLKIESINCYSSYVEDYLRPIFKAYGALVEEIAIGSPQAVLDKSAGDITSKVKDSAAKLEECLAEQKQADDYFQESKLGK